jgi:formylglycine-generating enzyme required for sulfatase activity
MGGNVAEWVHDFYDAAISMAGGAEIDPLGPEAGEFHVIKGASWAHGTITEMRLSYRDYAAEAREDVGFRLARYLE